MISMQHHLPQWLQMHSRHTQYTLHQMSNLQLHDCSWFCFLCLPYSLYSRYMRAGSTFCTQRSSRQCALKYPWLCSLGMCLCEIVFEQPTCSTCLQASLVPTSLLSRICHVVLTWSVPAQLYGVFFYQTAFLNTCGFMAKHLAGSVRSSLRNAPQHKDIFARFQSETRGLSQASLVLLAFMQ